MSSSPNGAILEHPTGAVLAAYGHGQLDDLDLVSVDAHLAECDECRLVVEGVGPDTLLTLLRSAATDVDDPPSPKAAASKATLIIPPQELLAHPRYKVGELLGIGGMGAVYKAEHLLMERPVALKVLDRKLTDNPATTDRFRREVRAAARLTHPHIVAAFDAEQAGDVHFLVMEFVDGVSLARRLAEKGPLPVEEACDFIRQASLGLQHAHERGMVHRDIKPQNLMLTPAGQVKILDFGLARFVMECVPGDANISLEEEPLAFGKESMAIRLTHTGLVMGTPDYIAPEQARDSHLADIRADIYSLGCTLYELLAGQSPFPEGKAVDKVRGHLSRTPQPLDQLRRDVPPELLRIVERMMAKEPANRFQTPADVAAALTPFTAAPPPPRRSYWPAIAACLGFFAFLLAGAVIYIQTDNGRIVVETDDDTIAVMIQKAGGVKIVDPANGREYHLRPGEQAVRSGEYLIDVSEPLAGLQFQTKRFELKRGKEVRLTAKYETSRKGGGQLPTDNPQTESDSADDGLYQGKPAAYWQKKLRDGDPTYREEAIKALAGIARSNKSLIPTIIAVLGDEQVTTTPEVLADLGVDALPALIGVLTTKPSPRAAQDAALAVARMGPTAKAAIPSLLSAAQSDDDRISGAAIYALSKVRADAAVALPVIADALAYRLKSGVRISNVTLTLGNSDGSRTSFGRNLFSAVNKLDREIGSFILEKFPDDGRSTVKPLDEKELAHRWQLIHDSLKKKYPVAAPFVPAFAPATAVDEGTYQGKPTQHWRKQLDDGDPKFRAEAIKALGGIAQKNPKLIPILVGALADNSEIVGEEAAEALRDLGEAAYPTIIEILQHRKNEAARVRMANALVNRRVAPELPGVPAGGLAGALGGGGIGGLAPAPFPANATVSGFAAAPLPLLLDTLKIHDDDIRVATIKALGRHGEKARVAVPRLVEFLGLALDKLEDGVAKGTPIADLLIELPYHVLDAIVTIDPASSKIVPKEILKIPDGTATELKQIVPKWRKAHQALAASYPPGSIPSEDREPSTKGKVKYSELEGEMFDGQPFEHWWKKFMDHSPPVRTQGIHAIGVFAKKNRTLIPELVTALADDDPVARKKAENSVSALGVDAIPTLLAVATDASRKEIERERAVEAVGRLRKHASDEVVPKIGDRAVPVLAKLLSDKALRESAIAQLRFFGPEGKSAIPAVVKTYGAILDEASKLLRAKDDAEFHNKIKLGFETLTTLNSLDKDLVFTIESKSNEEALRRYREIYEELRKKYPPAQVQASTDASKVIIEDGEPLYLGKSAAFWWRQYQDTAPKFRVEAIEALGNLAMKDKNLIPKVIAGLNDGDLEVGQKAAAMLKQIGPDALTAILTGVDRKSPVAVRHAANAIAMYFAKGKDATPLLIDALKMDDWSTRRSATAALLRIGPDAKSSLPALVDLMGVSLATKEIAEQIDRTARFHAEGKKNQVANFGFARAMPIEILEAILFIDPDVKGALPEGIHNAGKVRSSTGINLGASLELWRQTHETLKKRYPK